MFRLHAGDGGRADVDGGGGGQAVSAADENTESTEFAHHSQLDAQAEVVAGAQVSLCVLLGDHSQLHVVVTDSTDYRSSLPSTTVVILKLNKITFFPSENPSRYSKKKIHGMPVRFLRALPNIHTVLCVQSNSLSSVPSHTTLSMAKSGDTKPYLEGVTPSFL